MAGKHSEFLKFEKGVYENPHTMSLLLFLSLRREGSGRTLPMYMNTWRWSQALLGGAP